MIKKKKKKKHTNKKNYKVPVALATCVLEYVIPHCTYCIGDPVLTVLLPQIIEQFEFSGIPIWQANRQTNVHLKVFLYDYFYKNYISTYIGLPVCLLNGDSAKLNCIANIHARYHATLSLNIRTKVMSR